MSHSILTAPISPQSSNCSRSVSCGHTVSTNNLILETGKVGRASCTVTLTDDIGIDIFRTLCFHTMPFWRLAGKYVI